MFTDCINLLKKRGVEVEDIVELVKYLQKDYHHINEEIAYAAIVEVIKKREVQHAIMTGIELDIEAEKHKMFNKELNDELIKDQSLFGVDEVLAYGICNLYGSIALTNFGYIDKVKPGILKKINIHDGVHCNCFLDDIVGAIAASAASKLAHNDYNE